MPAPKVITWVLVADGARARILVNEGPGKGLRPVEEHEAPHLHARSHDLGSERPGRTQESLGVGRHAIEPRIDWHTYEKHLFAKSMAELLNAAAVGGRFERLVLVAPPHTLGELRAALNKHARDRLKGELNKDLTHLSDSQLGEPLSGVLAV